MSRTRCLEEADTEALEKKSPTLANIRSILGCTRLVSALIICGMICCGAFLLVWDQLRALATETQNLRLEMAVRMRAVEVRIEAVAGGATRPPDPVKPPPLPPPPAPGPGDGKSDTKVTTLKE